MKTKAIAIACVAALSLAACTTAGKSPNSVGINPADPTHLEYWRSMHGPK